MCETVTRKNWLITGVLASGKCAARARAQLAKIAKPTGSKLVKGPAESEKFVRWKSKKNSEENS